jgi:hypothetical protein
MDTAASELPAYAGSNVVFLAADDIPVRRVYR